MPVSLGIGLGLAPRTGGVPANAVLLNGVLITLNAQPITKAS